MKKTKSRNVDVIALMMMKLHKNVRALNCKTSCSFASGVRVNNYPAAISRAENYCSFPLMNPSHHAVYTVGVL